MDSLQQIPNLQSITTTEIESYIRQSDRKVAITFARGKEAEKDFEIIKESEDEFTVILNNPEAFANYQADLQGELEQYSILAGITGENVNALYKASKGRSFFSLYVLGIMLIGLGIIAISRREKVPVSPTEPAPSYTLPFTLVLLIGMVLWFIPGLTILGRIVSFIIYITVTSLFIIDKSDPAKFKDHAKFLLMIFLYSGFWILYFQMFDSVLWYVQAYVDAASLNTAINKFLGVFGLHINWFFDVEHVTVINAGTIILLQLFISNIVKKRKALPTMITGIGVGTMGMAILAISTDIWIFLIGIILFSVGEMTAHPKFISYIGLIAPPDKKAMYMGYLFLYGVFGSSIGGIMGARLYVHFVDNLNQPKTLWLIFSCIGVATILALLLYNRFLAAKDSKH
jgi:dipeptide/tripeptide permease